jgi:hypothetical protein
MGTLHVETRTTIDADYVTYFRERMNTLTEYHPPELLLNMDETCWRLYEARMRILKEKGKKKTSFTAFRWITCSGDKFPLCVIAKGKTK